MVYLLQAHGYGTITAYDGEAGISAALSHRPALIICDIQLPVLDGYGVVRRLKADAVTAAIPVVAVTALAMVGDRDRILEAGFTGYLSKPIDPEAFVRQVEVYLGAPSTPVATAHPASALQPGPDTKNATILAVDNVPANLQLLCSILEPFGYHVITARSGHDALLKACDRPPDLILSDICMADGDGHELIKAVKASEDLSDIPFIFLTSSRLDSNDRDTGLSFGASRFLYRPIEPEVLLAEIAACLETA